MVVSPCYVLLLWGRTRKGARQLHVKGSSKTCSERQFSRPLLFYSIAGRIIHQTFQVMRRRLQGIRHTDCTARMILGRRNRYAPAATTITKTPAVDNEPVSRAPKSGNGGLFLVAVLNLGTEYLNFSHLSWVFCVFFSGSVPVFESIDRIVVYNYLSQNLSTLGGPAAQFGAAECGSVSVQRRSVAPFSDLSYNSKIIAGVSQLAEIKQYATSAVQFGAAELCNSVLYLLPMRSISAPQTIYSIMELLAVKNRTLDDPRFRLRRVVPFLSAGNASTNFYHTHGSHSWGSVRKVGREFVRFYFTIIGHKPIEMR